MKCDLCDIKELKEGEWINVAGMLYCDNCVLNLIEEKNEVKNKMIVKCGNCEKELVELSTYLVEEIFYKYCKKNNIVLDKISKEDNKYLVQGIFNATDLVDQILFESEKEIIEEVLNNMNSILPDDKLKYIGGEE